ncbi:MAG: hypothetical protein K9H64_05030 [Bacteroidales bacterium]|nr:hypothetical protein [Bacteroidales bacterium]MCF8455201.1 hypothetical protein [Bacteroidales bacterium]
MLTKEQTDWIRTNIRNRGIETIDLEHEMVDHISSAVEEKLDEGVAFRDAYKSVVNEFGPFGLKKLQYSKNIKLRKKGRRMIFRNMKAYLKPPKIALTLLIAAILFTLYSIIDIRYYVYYSVIAISLFAPVTYLLASKQRRQLKEKFTCIKAMYQINDNSIFLYYIFYVQIIIGDKPTSIAWMTISSMIVIILSLAFYASINQSIAEIKSEFGELELA